jgi:hypothetical protein
MAVETRNPLPAGRYWIDVSKEPVPFGTWQGFLSAFPESIHVDNTEEDDEFAFSIFTTTKSLVWPEGIGYPTIAGSSIKSRADTVQRPDPEPDLTDQLPTVKQLVSGVGDTVKLVAVVVGIIVAVKLLSSGRGRKTAVS